MSTSKPDKAEDYKRWQMPEVLDEKIIEKQKRVTAAELETIQQQAYAEAYEKGYQDGVAKGMQDGQDKIHKQLKLLDGYMQKLAQPFEELDESVIQQVTELSIAIAKHLVRRELNILPSQVIAVVREAMSVLPVTASDIKIRLHPEDATLVREAFSLDQESSASRLWKIVDDPVLNRGDCIVSTENSNVDARLETRINRIVVGLLGGERDGDSNDDAS